jgi:hypothetical protein
MLRWFQSKPTCPIDADERQWIDVRWTWLAEAFRGALSQQPQLILPNNEFFPDPYDGSLQSAELIFNRVCAYMGIDAERVELNFFYERDPLTVGPDGLTCGGAVGYYSDEEDCDAYLIWLKVTILDDPTSIVVTLAHELGHVLLLGEGRIDDDEDDHEPLTDLLTVYLGLGIFSANAVISGNGSDIGSTGYLSMRAYGYALALFARERKKDGDTWTGYLRPDVRKAFRQSLHFLAARENGRA